jgi:hypothetical protein
MHSPPSLHSPPFVTVISLAEQSLSRVQPLAARFHGLVDRWYVCLDAGAGGREGRIDRFETEKD